MTAATLVRPATVETRKHHCGCGRYLGESTAKTGYIVVKCPGCGRWARLEFGNVVR
jgi:sarcosine oxidase delta subunit